MRRIKSKHTGPELTVRSLLHRMGFRFRLHVKELPGHPDIVLPKWRCVIFVNGCFWHQHKECKAGSYMPKTNTEYWKRKFASNRENDRRSQEALETMGWHVITVWECETKPAQLDRLKNTLFTEIINE